MQKTLSLQFIALATVLAFAFGITTQALASTSYDEIEIEYEVRDSKTVVDVEYVEDIDEDDTEVLKQYTYFTTDLDEVWAELADDLGLSVDDIEDILAGEYGDDGEEGNRDDAEEEIDDASLLLEDAFYEVEDEDDVDAKAVLQACYDTAENLIEEAEEEFGLGNYAEAEALAEDAIDELNECIFDEEDAEEKEDAEEAIEDAEEAIAEAKVHIEDQEEDGKDVEDLEEWLAIAEGYLEDAGEALEEGDYDEAEELAEKAESKAEYILGKNGGDEKEDKVYVCHNDKNTLKISVSALDDHLDHGDTKGKCDYDNDKKKDWNKDKKQDYKDFGKSTDQAELRAQLELLIDLLIELLRARL